MSKKLYTLFLLAVLAFLPISIMAIAPLPQPTAGSFDISTAISGIFDFIWPIFGAIAILMFIYAGFTYVSSHGDPSKVSTATKALIWGVVGLAVAFLSTSIPFIIKRIVS